MYTFNALWADHKLRHITSGGRVLPHLWCTKWMKWRRSLWRQHMIPQINVILQLVISVYCMAPHKNLCHVAVNCDNAGKNCIVHKRCCHIPNVKDCCQIRPKTCCVPRKCLCRNHTRWYHTSSMFFQCRWSFICILIGLMCLYIIIIPLDGPNKTFDYIFRLLPSMYVTGVNPGLKYLAWFILGNRCFELLYLYFYLVN